MKASKIREQIAAWEEEIESNLNENRWIQRKIDQLERQLRLTKE